MPVLTKINTNVIADNAVTSAKIPADAVIASDIAAGAVGISELATVTGVTAEYHKVPVYANNAARDHATTGIPSPAVGMIIYNTTAGALQQYNGTWAAIVPAPNITGLSGFLNNDNDSTLTIFGSNFNTVATVKMFTAASGGTQIGSNATVTFVSSSNLKAAFGAGSIGASGSTAYIEVDNAGIANRFATAITVNADPVIALSGNTGTGADTTDHLGTYGGAGVGGGDDSNTALLLNFDRGGGTDFEDNSNIGANGHKTTATNNAIIKASPFGDGKTAFRHTGVNDQKINVAYGTDNADFSFGTGDFCVDYWINYTSHIQNGVILGIGMPENTSDTALVITDWHQSPWMKIELNDGASGAAQYWQPLNGMAAAGIETGCWFHQAITKTGTTMRFFLDGVLISTITGSVITGNGSLSGSVPASMTVPTASQNVVWGGGSADFTSELNGYMDEMRIVKGETIFPAAGFTPSQYRYGHGSATHEATTASNVKLLLHSNRTTTSSSSSDFVDSSPSAHAVTVNTGNPGVIHSTLYNHAESTVVTPTLTYPASGKTWGSTGAYFDGTGDHLLINPFINLSTYTNWTAECWFYITGPAATDALATMMAGVPDYYWGIMRSSDSKLSAWLGSGSSWTLANEVKGPTTLLDNTWYHVAFVKDSTNYKMYLNGTLEITIATTAAIGSSTQMNIGNNGSLGGWGEMEGYIDGVRISTTNRYSANFTPETTLYGAAASSVLPTITFTGATTPALASDEDIEYTEIANTTKAANNQKFSDSGLGLTFTNTADSSLATLTGTLASDAGTTHTNMIVKAQVRKTLGNAAYANASRTVTFSSSTTTAGLAPAMPVSGTGIPASTTITTVDSSTTITLSANPTGGTLTGQSLIFEDLTRITHINGSDTLNNADTMMTIAAGAGGDPVLFNARRYRGNAATRSITGYGFKPDFVAIKRRSSSANWVLQDSVRGVNKNIQFNTTTAEYTDTTSLGSFDSDGFSIGIQGQANADNETAIAYGWKAGGVPSGELVGTGATMSGTSGAGTIHNSATGVTLATSLTQSVSQTSGFSITTYTGGATGINQISSFPHNLGGTPNFITVKRLDAAENWPVYHTNLTADKNLVLDSNYPETQGHEVYGYIDAPSSTLINLNSFTDASSYGNRTNRNAEPFICYAWKAVAGVSAFGSYTVSGTTGGPKVTLDFRPRLIMVKVRNQASSYGSWTMIDAFRSTGWGTSGTVSIAAGAATLPPIYADQDKVEGQRAGSTSDSEVAVTIFDDGFQFTNDNHSETTSNAGVYIYAAFA